MGVRSKADVLQRKNSQVVEERAKNAEAESQINVKSFKKGMEPLPLIYGGQWLCNKTLLDVARIVTDGIQASELKWTPEMKQTNVPIWINSEGKLCSMFEQRIQGVRQKQKVTGELQSQNFGPELLVWENGHVWRRAPTRECPDSWLAVDAQIVRTRKDKKASTKGKVHKGAKLTVIKVEGREAYLSMPVNGWVTASKVVMKTEGTSLPREHVHQLLLPDDPVQRLQRSGSLERLLRRFSDPSVLKAAEPPEATLQKERRSSEPNVNAAEAVKVGHPIGDLFEIPKEFSDNDSLTTTTDSMDGIIKVVEDKEVKTDQTDIPNDGYYYQYVHEALEVNQAIDEFMITENLDAFDESIGNEKSMTSYFLVEL
jgi:hypothetical protein